MMVLLAPIAWSCGTEEEKAEVITCPVVVTKGGHLMVEATVSGSVKSRFIFDTGGGIHIISSAILNQIASTPRGTFTAIRHTGEPVELETFDIESIELNGIREENPIVATWPALDAAGIDGILSLKLFEDRPFTLDLINKVIICETPESLTSIAEKGKSVPLKTSDDRGISLDIFADFTGTESVRLECIIDTGSPGTIIDARHMAELGINPDAEGVQKREREEITGTTRTEYLAALPSLSLRDLPGSAINDIQTVFKEKMIYDGLVGMDFFIDRSFTFDIPGRRLISNTDAEQD